MSWEESDKKDTLKKYGINLLNSCCTPDDAKNIYLPSNAHLITYTVEDTCYYDIVQCYSKSTIFDAYYDTLGPNSIISIVPSAGSINPKIYGAKPAKEKRRNS